MKRGRSPELDSVLNNIGGRERSLRKSFTGSGRMRVSVMNTIGTLQLVFNERSYRFLALVIFVPTLALYAFTLPAAYTGGIIGLVSLRLLNGELIFFSIALAALLSLALTLNIYAFRASARRPSRGLTLGALVSSLLPAAVCCTPAIPSLLAILGASTPQIFGITGQVQGFFVTYESLFLAGALILLIFALFLSARTVSGACRVPQRSTDR